MLSLGKYPLAHPSAALVDAVTTLSSEPEDGARTLRIQEACNEVVRGLCESHLRIGVQADFQTQRVPYPFPPFVST